jgi:hypothetical protein
MRAAAIILLVGCSLLPWAARAQDAQPVDRIELGEASELKGVRSVCVDTGGEPGAMRVIVASLKKNLPGLALADRPEGADAVLEFRPDRQYWKVPGTGRVYIGGGTDVPFYTGMDVSPPATWTEYYGSGLVYRRVAEDRIRIFAEYTGDQPSRSREHHPKQFAKAFMKAWRKANGQ